MLPMLQGKIAVVTGASRGAGRGIAQELGAAGATVYVTGRSTRDGSRTLERPETIEETAEMVTGLGGRGIPIRVDHTVDAEVSALFKRVEAEQGRLDILVNNAWGGHDRAWPGGAFWETPDMPWDIMFEAGVRAHLVATRCAIPLMLPRGAGLVVTTSFFDQGKYTGNFWYDLAKNALNRMAYGMAQDLKSRSIASVALSPGFMRTEVVLDTMGATEQTWQDVPRLARTETPRYAGRAVVALAADPQVLTKTGQFLTAGDLAREYGFTDVDGRYIPAYVLQ
jgi:NAD(P)-dependent dehydrogenase (short-subunit alcohol dehydrogenase family)